MAEKFQLRVGVNCWRVEDAARFALIIDGADYFVTLRRALLKARESIMLIGWDFDPRITFGNNDDGGPARLGDFILWLADRQPGLQIRLLRWDTGAFKSMLRGNTLWTVMRWKMHPRITLRLDGAHPLAGSHHQKIAVIDDSIGFCGGIDMTMQRWDTRRHLDDDPRRTSPSGRPQPPWHDATSACDGDSARALGDLARDRWRAATGEVLPACDARHDCWPAGLVPAFRNMRLAISRTIPKMKQVAPVHEIEAAWIEMIAAATDWIYAESQYFASRKIAHAIAKRLREEDPPEIVIINPDTANGWLEPIAMDSARAKLVRALRGIDHKNRLRIYHPLTRQGKPIYVHAKIMIVDGVLLRIGSSNFNNRSMQLDTECDVILSASEGENAQISQQITANITALRDDLLAEHLGLDAAQLGADITRSGSMIATIEALSGKGPGAEGQGGGRSLVAYEIPRLSRAEHWLAENEILDPNGPEEIFESTSKRGLFKGWGHIVGRFHKT
jgi:phosphatidylserine/phosphatidylglycerophosphate/cardiolipin synthase-like enzyme